MAKLRRTVDPEAATKHVLRQQLRDFRKKFGRDPLPAEPVFSDSDQDVPMEMSEAKLREGLLELLSEFPPQFAYAYAKSGPLLLLEQQVEHYSGWRARARVWPTISTLLESAPRPIPSSSQRK
jgi:hypothetical protein